MEDESDDAEEIFAFSVARVVLCSDGLLVMQRNRGEFDLDVDMPEIVRGVLGVVEEHGHRARGILIDVRMGTGRHEPEFEEAVAKFNRILAERFGKVAWLVGTNVGVLQARRFARQLQIELQAFQDEGEARRWLLS